MYVFLLEIMRTIYSNLNTKEIADYFEWLSFNENALKMSNICNNNSTLL